MRRFFPDKFYNLTTLTGAALACVSIGVLLFFALLDATAEISNPYIGIFAFVILPIVLVTGLLLIAAGIIRENRREREGKPLSLRLPVIDLNNPRQRVAVTTFSVGTVLVLCIIGFASFKVYEHTESDQFCGETCHSVMEPEYTAYQSSPHARVGCVQCHVGSGAEHYVKSKVSGSYQVYSILFNKYPKPIPTPLEDLRPAQQTCEKCHWPKHFFSEKQEKNTYFMSDDKNTSWTLNLLLKVGGGSREAGPSSGIHWHMNLGNEVTYAALDTQRQVIPWVKSTSINGKVKIYRSTEVEIAEDSLKKLFTRRMDCIDCHNRPTHIYNPPARSVNTAMSLGWIDPALPNAKSIAVEALENPYSTKAGAIDSIRLAISEFYAKNHPEVAKSKKSAIDSAIAEVQNIYRRNYFPEMNVSWKKYPDNIGHLYFNGCFRCHDGKHVSESGEVLSKDCNTCHTLLAQKFPGDSLRLGLAGVEFKHPVDVGDAWKEMNCTECHAGAQ